MRRFRTSYFCGRDELPYNFQDLLHAKNIYNKLKQRQKKKNINKSSVIYVHIQILLLVFHIGFRLGPLFLRSFLDCVSLKESLCRSRKIGTWIDNYVKKNKNTTATPSKETKAHNPQEKLQSNSDLLIIHVTCFCPNHYSLILLNSCFSKDVIHHLQCSLTWSNESFWLHKINILGAIQLLMFKETLHKCQISLIIFTVNRRSP